MKTQQYLTPAGELIEVQVDDTQQGFLTPASPGKPGELVVVKTTAAVQANERQQFAEPVPYWTQNDKAVSDLRAKVQQAERELEHARSRGVDDLRLRRFEDALTAAREELEDAEGPRRRERERQRTGGDYPPPTNTQHSRTDTKKPAAPGSAEAEAGWARYFAALDAKLAGRTTAATSAACCVGEYKCSKCKRAAA